MKAGTLVGGVLLVLCGFLEYTGTTSFLTGLEVGLPPETLALLILLVGLTLAVAGAVLPLKKPAAGPAINPNEMKSCPECGKLMPPDAFRCPKCGARFRALRENL